MAFRQILDSDVDRLTAMAIQGVNAFITMYDEEREVTAGIRSPARRPARAKRAAPAKRRKK